MAFMGRRFRHYAHPSSFGHWSRFPAQEPRQAKSGPVTARAFGLPESAGPVRDPEPPREHPSAARADEARARTRPFGPEPVTAFARPPVGVPAVDGKGSWGALRAPKGPNPRPLL